MINYSVIIPTLNQASKLERCLVHLSNLDYDSGLFEVLVVDNGSVDETRTVALSFKNRIPNLTYHLCETPGLMAARHMGCDKAGGEILCYLDDDSLVTHGWLSGIAQAFKEDNVVIAGGPCIPRYEVEPPKWIEYLWEYTDYGRLNAYLSLIDFGDKLTRIHPGYVFGCNYSIRKNILLDFGGTCPDYYPDEYKRFIGDGETGLSLKLHKAGHAALYSPEARIEHLIPAGRLTIEYFCWRRHYNGIHSSYRMIRDRAGLDQVNHVNKQVIGPPPGSEAVSPFVAARRILSRKLRSLRASLSRQEPREVTRIKSIIEKSYEKGFSYHQTEVKKDPSLLQWVLRENYLGENGRLPAIFPPHDVTDSKASGGIG